MSDATFVVVEVARYSKDVKCRSGTKYHLTSRARKPNSAQFNWVDTETHGRLARNYTINSKHIWILSGGMSLEYGPNSHKAMPHFRKYKGHVPIPTNSVADL